VEDYQSLPIAMAGLPFLTKPYARHARPIGGLGLVYQTLPHGTYKTIGALGWSTNVLPNFTIPYRPKSIRL